MSKLLALIIPAPAIALTKAISDAGAAVAEPYSMTLPVPGISATKAVTSVANPDGVYVHDDDLLIDTAKTTEANSEPTVGDGLISGANSQIGATSTIWLAQTFTPAIDYTVTVLRLMLYGSGLGTVTVSLRATDVNGHPTGTDLISATYAGAQIPTDASGDLIDFGLGAGYALTAATKYAIVLRVASGTLYWKTNTAGGLAGGNREHSTDSGTNWTAYLSEDFMFQTLSANTLDVPPFPNPPSTGDGLYIGGATQFDWVYFWLNQAAEGTFETAPKYYNGSIWVALSSYFTGGGDESGSWKKSGKRRVSFLKPPDWTVFAVDGNSWYWVKMEVTSATSLTTMPAIGHVSIGRY